MIFRKLVLLPGVAALLGSLLISGATAEAAPVAPAGVQAAFPGCAPVIGNDSVRVTIRNASCARTISVSVIWYHHFTGATWPSRCYSIAPGAAQSYLYPSNVYDFYYPQSEHLCA